MKKYNLISAKSIYRKVKKVTEFEKYERHCIPKIKTQSDTTVIA